MLHENVFPRVRAAAVAGAILALGVLAGCGGTATNALPDLPVQQTEYQLGNGDRVLVTVFGQEELTGERVVDGGGNISMPLIGEVKAGGSTADELASTIAAELTPKYLNDPKVNIQVLGYRPFYIVGEVQKPGSYPYVDGMVVMNAVALAGGFTYRAREDAVYITRSSDPERHKRVADVNAPVQPGDVVTVRERYF
ncbi:MAG TPA: polysaccharide biosynthesis/export family protein [Thalassobaculum sp.]